MKALLLILVLTVTISAQSVKEGKKITNWLSVGHSPDIRIRPDGTPMEPGVRVEGTGKAEMSFADIRRSGELFKGWVRFVFPDSAIVFHGSWNEARFYVHCDCQKNSIKVLSGIVYNLNGSVLAEERQQILEHAKAGTVGRDLFEFFCERGGPVTTSPPTLKPKS